MNDLAANPAILPTALTDSAPVALYHYTGPGRPLYANPAHPYTERLLAAIPRVDLKGQELYTIKGIPPNLTRIPAGCAFHPRCPYAQPICVEQVPPLQDISGDRRSACHFWKETLDGSIQNR